MQCNDRIQTYSPAQMNVRRFGIALLCFASLSRKDNILNREIKEDTVK